MEVSFYRHRSSFDILPTLTINIVESNGNYAYCLLVGWFEWTFDIQW